jgi:hypothetical protein
VSDKPGEPRDLVIGIDLGTSCSKVVLRDAATRDAFAVPFGKLAHEGHPYLLPSLVRVARNGSLSLTSGDFLADHVKLRLVRAPDGVVLRDTKRASEISGRELAAGYIALVLRLVREWFLDTHDARYRNVSLRWHLNLGMPSKDSDDEAQKREFEWVGTAAWLASVAAGELGVGSVKGAMKEARTFLDAGRRWPLVPEAQQDARLWEVCILPEVIAEVVGYAQSDLKRHGTHLLVDVGAATLDVATFILHEAEGEDRYGILTTAVEYLGAYALHGKRCSAVAKAVEDHIQKQIQSVDGIAPLPESDSYRVPVQSVIEAVDEQVKNQCLQAVFRVVDDTRKNRDPKPFLRREFSLPVITCGGGSRMDLYSAAVRGVRKYLALIKGLDEIQLPFPKQLLADGLTRDEYHRLAVAYGLSFLSVEIGSITPAHAIEDIPPDHNRQNWSDSFIGKDLM